MFGAGYVEDERAMSVVNAAYDQGINFIDTADAYNSGLSEHVVGKAVKGHRHDFVIATKGFIATGTSVNNVGLSRKHLMQAVEASLRRLDTDYIDLYQVHYFDPDTPLEESLGTLDDMVHQGKIRYLGCSNHAAWQLCKALWVSDKSGFARLRHVAAQVGGDAPHAVNTIEVFVAPVCVLGPRRMAGCHVRIGAWTGGAVVCAGQQTSHENLVRYDADILVLAQGK